MSAPAQAAADDSSRAAPLRNPGFRRLLAYRICSILSYQVVAVTVGWQVYELTRNPWMLGLIGLAAWAVRRYAPQLMARLQAPRGERRLQVVETLVLDPARRLILVRVDDEERLILLGEGRELIEPRQPGGGK